MDMFKTELGQERKLLAVHEIKMDLWGVRGHNSGVNKLTGLALAFVQDVLDPRSYVY